MKCQLSKTFFAFTKILVYKQLAVIYISVVRFSNAFVFIVCVML